MGLVLQSSRKISLAPNAPALEDLRSGALKQRPGKGTAPSAKVAPAGNQLLCHGRVLSLGALLSARVPPPLQSRRPPALGSALEDAPCLAASSPTTGTKMSTPCRVAGILACSFSLTSRRGRQPRATRAPHQWQGGFTTAWRIQRTLGRGGGAKGGFQQAELPPPCTHILQEASEQETGAPGTSELSPPSLLGHGKNPASSSHGLHTARLGPWLSTGQESPLLRLDRPPPWGICLLFPSSHPRQQGLGRGLSVQTHSLPRPRCKLLKRLQP